MEQEKKDNPNDRSPRTGRARNQEIPKQDLPDIPDQDAQVIHESGEGENPEWWRGDPGKRGEVL